MSDEQRTHDLSTIDRYLDGDESAFHDVDIWIRREIASRYSLLSNEAEDLCQSIHIKLLENLRSGRFHGRSSLRTYVIGITHYTAIDRIRQVYRERLHAPGWDPLGGSASESPYRSIADLQDRQVLHLAVLQAPEACKVLWRLTYLERLPYDEVGRRLSISAGTVKSRMWYCRRKLLAVIERIGKLGRGRAGRA
jgi:RNA polymerase sigma factor (sigma-70 family)